MDTSSHADRPLAGRVAAVTGAGKGLGAAFARALAAQGAAVVVNNRIRPGAPDDATTIAEAIRAAGGQAVAEHSDITHPDAGARLKDAALGAFGRLDALVLNAGVSGEAKRFSANGVGALREVMETNFFANAAILGEILPELARGGAGRVVMVSSAAGLYGVKGRAAYAASKGALNAFAFTLADEWRGHGVTFNVLCPYAATRMTGAGEAEAPDALMAPDRIAPAAAWLCGEACDRSGEVWLGGGGWLRRVETVETAGGPMPDAPDALESFAESQAGLETARGFPGAEAAFADLFGAARAYRKEHA